jgi:hypothetical protein
MSIIGLSMAALPCCAEEEDVETGSAALRVDWPVYPHRTKHNTVAEGGNRRFTIAASSQMSLSPRSLVLLSKPTLPSGSVRVIASNASTVMATHHALGPPAPAIYSNQPFFVFTPQRPPENRWATKQTPSA